MASDDPFEMGTGVPHIYVRIENLYLTMDSSDIENAIKVRIDSRGGHSATDSIWDALEEAAQQDRWITVSEIIHDEKLDRNLVNVQVNRLYNARKIKRKKVTSPISGRSAWGYQPRRSGEEIIKRQTRKAIKDNE